MEARVDVHKKACHIVLALFKDKAARDAGKGTMDSVSYSWDGENYPFDKQTFIDQSANESNYLKRLVKIAYLKIKDYDSWFSDAKDV